MDCRTQIPAFVDSLQREIDNHDSVLLHNAEQKKQPDHAVERQCRSKDPKRGQTANDRGDNRRKQNGDRVNVAFVENSKNHIHHENCANQKQRQRAEELTEHERFALES